jgi:hypothetical protein
MEVKDLKPTIVVRKVTAEVKMYLRIGKDVEPVSQDQEDRRGAILQDKTDEELQQ